MAVVAIVAAITVAIIAALLSRSLRPCCRGRVVAVVAVELSRPCCGRRPSCRNRCGHVIAVVAALLLRSLALLSRSLRPCCRGLVVAVVAVELSRSWWPCCRGHRCCGRRPSYRSRCGLVVASCCSGCRGLVVAVVGRRPCCRSRHGRVVTVVGAVIAAVVAAVVASLLRSSR